MEENKTLPVAVDDGFKKYLREINNIPCLSKEEEFLLAKNYLDNHDIEAAQRLVTSHLKLVAKIAMRYKNYGLPLTDIVSEGNIGLMQAVKKYDPDLGYRLSTYAMWWIKASIQEYVLRSWSLVKIGTTSAQKKLFFSLGKIKNKITNLYSRAVNTEDYAKIASDLGVTTKEVYEMNQRMIADLSLNGKVNKEDSSSEMLDFIAEPRPSHEFILINQQDATNKQRLLSEAMLTLNPREHKILSARKLQDHPSTLEDLSEEYKISKERIRQIEARAFEKIQSYILQKHP